MKHIIYTLFIFFATNFYSQESISNRDAYTDSILLDSKLKVSRGFLEQNWNLNSKPLAIHNLKLKINVVNLDSTIIQIINPNTKYRICIDSFSSQYIHITLSNFQKSFTLKSTLFFIQKNYSYRSKDRYALVLSKSK